MGRTKHIAVAASALAFAGLLAGACKHPEYDAVEHYKTFLDDAKSALASMNQTRDKLNAIKPEELDDLVPLFRDHLLPDIKKLRSLADTAQPESPDLATIHNRFKGLLRDYDERTEELVKHLEAAPVGADGDKARGVAILDWGEADKAFGDGMQGLVKEIKRYLDKVKRS